MTEPQLDYSKDCFDEPLLEYVCGLANHCFPDVDSDQSHYPIFFMNRLKEHMVRRPCHYSDYINTDKYQNIYFAIQHHGFDHNKFWFLLLFVSDIIDGAFAYEEDKRRFPIEEIKELVERINSNLNLKGRAKSSPDMELTLTCEGKKVCALTSVDAIQYLSLALGTFNSDPIVDNAKQRVALKAHSLKVMKSARKVKAVSPKIAYFNRLMDEFIYKVFPLLSKDASTTPQYKRFLISRLVWLIGLTENKKYDESAQSLINLCKQPTYKNIKLNRINKFYTL